MQPLQVRPDDDAVGLLWRGPGPNHVAAWPARWRHRRNEPSAESRELRIPEGGGIRAHRGPPPPVAPGKAGAGLFEGGLPHDEECQEEKNDGAEIPVASPATGVSSGSSGRLYTAHFRSARGAKKSPTPHTATAIRRLHSFTKSLIVCFPLTGIGRRPGPIVTHRQPFRVEGAPAAGKTAVPWPRPSTRGREIAEWPT